MKNVTEILSFFVIETFYLIARVLLKYRELKIMDQKIKRVRFRLIKFEDISAQIDIISVS